MSSVGFEAWKRDVLHDFDDTLGEVNVRDGLENEDSHEDDLIEDDEDDFWGRFETSMKEWNGF